MNKLSTLYTSLQASESFNAFIQSIVYEKSYSFGDTIDPIINRSLLITFAKIIILSLKEEIILKPKNDLYSNNLFSSIQELVDKIAYVQTDGSVDMNGKIFPDGNTLVASIRNKLAHGDYTYSDDVDFIIFNYDGTDVYVRIEELLNFAIKLMNLKGEYKKTPVHTRSIELICTPWKKTYRTIMRTEDLEAILDYCFNYQFTLTSSSGNIPKEAFESFDYIVNQVHELNHYYRDEVGKNRYKKIDENLNRLIIDFKEKSTENNWNVELTYIKKQLVQIQKDDIIKFYRKTKKSIIDYNSAINELPQYALRVLDESYNKDISVIKCGYLILFLKYAIQYKNHTVVNIEQAISNALHRRIIINQDEYALAQIVRLLDLSYMFENFDIDYSILPIDKLKPSLFKVDEKDINEVYIKTEATEKKLNKTNEKVENIKNQIENLENKELSAEKKKSIIKMLSDKLKELDIIKQEYEESWNYYKQQAYLMMKDRTEREKYYYNYSLMERIRDSISHGNYLFIPTMDIDNSIIRFEDKENGKKVFMLEVSVGDLNRTLNDCIKQLTKEEGIIRNK